jgi:N utilization substance protein B
MKRMSEKNLQNSSEGGEKHGISPKDARQARECALRALFQLDISEGNAENALKFATSMDIAGEVTEEAAEYAKMLIEGVINEKTFIDAVISRISKDWTLDRMAYTDRNLMRIAVFEMTQVEGLSMAVAINEAIELGKIFGSEDSPRFINGIVGRLAEELKSR